ncbi:MAG: preprotein translocase subunit SecE [Oscillospiraceae bacterium]|nr:preprotein translocase subunit SecE [Oscillospiraceae bacterium]
MAEATKKEGFFARIKRMFREMRSELKKVVWPTKRQLLNNVLVVLVCCLVVGACIWIFDAVAALVVQGIISLVTG